MRAVSYLTMNTSSSSTLQHKTMYRNIVMTSEEIVNTTIVAWISLLYIGVRISVFIFEGRGNSLLKIKWGYFLRGLHDPKNLHQKILPPKKFFPIPLKHFQKPPKILSKILHKILIKILSKLLSKILSK